MGRRTRISQRECILGKPIAQTVTRRDRRTPWPTACTGCGEEELHVAQPYGSCACAFIRAGAVLCRDCAIAYDLLTRGRTRIGGAPLSSEEWHLARQLRERGQRAWEAIHI